MTDFSQFNNSPKQNYYVVEKIPFGPTGGSTILYDIVTNLGRLCYDGYLVCDGPGDLRFRTGQTALEATTGGIIRIRQGERFNLAPLFFAFIQVLRDTSGRSEDNTAFRGYFI